GVGNLDRRGLLDPRRLGLGGRRNCRLLRGGLLRRRLLGGGLLGGGLLGRRGLLGACLRCRSFLHGHRSDLAPRHIRLSPTGMNQPVPLSIDTKSLNLWKTSSEEFDRIFAGWEEYGVAPGRLAAPNPTNPALSREYCCRFHVRDPLL